jgi:tetraacyldisaccharide 4'-kinase
LTKLKLFAANLAGKIAWIRAWAYKEGYMKSHRLGRPVISIGNITLGGTGKTPFTGFLSRLLLQPGLQPAILSRGYRGSAESGVLLVSDGRRILAAPEECGDEPYLLASTVSGAIVAVGKQRYRSAAMILERFPNSIFLLDDGFQHLQVQRDIDLVLLDVTARLADYRLFPAGRLREPLSALARASAIILTRTHQTPTSTAVRDILHRYGGEIPCFRFAHRISALRELHGTKLRPPDHLAGKRSLAFAAIGNPHQFLADLESHGYDIVESRLFRDHHVFSHADIQEILEAARRLEVEAILTTEKDAVRLRSFQFAPIPTFAVQIEVFENGSDAFSTWLFGRLADLDPHSGRENVEST